MAATPDLGSGGEIRVSSSLTEGTNQKPEGLIEVCNNYVIKTHLAN